MPRPNILLISSDQHNAEILGCMGNPVVRTPHLDALAADGALCTHAFTSHPICTPARTSVFTGLYSKSHGVYHNINMNYQPGKPCLPPERVAFPEVLADAGYHTSLFGKLHTRHEGGKNFGLRTARLVEGKCHFVSSPAEQDEYRRALAQRGYPPDVWKVWENDPTYATNSYATSPLPEADYIDTFIADMAVEHLRQVEGPFFSWVSFCTPHNPWDPPKPFDTMYDPAAIPLPHRKAGELETKPPQWVDQVARTIASLPARSVDPSLPGGAANAAARFPEEKTRRMLAAYYGQVSHLDQQIGRVLDALKARGLYDDTLVIFLSDHGDYCGNHGAFYKYAGLYDSLIRVPLLIRWPGARPGRRVDELVSLIDVAPTILDAAGLNGPADMDGRSLRPLLTGEAADWRQELFVETGATAAVLTPDWKLVTWQDGTEELYDRRRDPHDLDNLAAAPSLEPTRAALRERLAAWKKA
ncbi:sulfatase-like hydrolase/transferase [bacterium]|nr:sulfatase-like hydrolase/transferase [bacterium]